MVTSTYTIYYVIITVIAVTQFHVLVSRISSLTLNFLSFSEWVFGSYFHFHTKASEMLVLSKFWVLRLSKLESRITTTTTKVQRTFFVERIDFFFIICIMRRFSLLWCVMYFLFMRFGACDDDVHTIVVFLSFLFSLRSFLWFNFISFFVLHQITIIE